MPDKHDALHSAVGALDAQDVHTRGLGTAIGNQ